MGLCLYVVGLEVKGISCRVKVGRITTFFIDGSSCFCRIVARMMRIGKWLSGVWLF